MLRQENCSDGDTKSFSERDNTRQDKPIGQLHSQPCFQGTKGRVLKAHSPLGQQVAGEGSKMSVKKQHLLAPPTKVLRRSSSKSRALPETGRQCAAGSHDRGDSSGMIRFTVCGGKAQQQTGTCRDPELF